MVLQKVTPIWKRNIIILFLTINSNWYMQSLQNSQDITDFTGPHDWVLQVKPVHLSYLSLLLKIIISPRQVDREDKQLGQSHI